MHAKSSVAATNHRVCVRGYHRIQARGLLEARSGTEGRRANSGGGTVTTLGQEVVRIWRNWIVAGDRN